MKKLLMLLFVAGLVMACNNDKGGKENSDKSTGTNREKDDYRNADNKTKQTAPDANTSATGEDNKTSGQDDSKNGWDDTKSRTGWVDADQTRFMKDCERTATRNVGAARANEYCDCMLQKLMKLYPTYTTADRELAEPAAKSKLDAMVADCNNQ